ncbi:endonuclease domain-containing protein [Streptomyces sp. NPDC051041]|uniref:endonuclease domain-containing protein n=1 Tax=Streptomyces sp. NPDC051041 TaxID=3365640 RepID=UPI003798FAE6
MCRICDESVYADERRYGRNLCPECGPADRQAKRYGLTVPRVNAILRVQNDRCPLCDDSPGDDAAYGPIWWRIDHDHDCCTGCPHCVRGLLCQPCNTHLGHYEKQLKQGRLRWPVPTVNAYLAAPPARMPEARKLHPDDFGWARVRATSLTWRIPTWKGQVWSPKSLL